MENMEKPRKFSSGGIVVDTKNKKILLTQRISQENKAWLVNILDLPGEHIFEQIKWCFTKGTIEEWETVIEAAYREIEEEWWIPSQELIFERELWFFTKEKTKTIKEIKMALFIIDKWYTETPKPTDLRHIARFITLEKAIEIMHSEEEKTFLLSIQKDIEEVFTTYQTDNVT